MLEHSIPVQVSSDPSTGSVNLSPDGSTFDVLFPEPISIPKYARLATVTVDEAQIWNNTPNIISGENDTFKMTSALAATHTVTVPQGLYNLTSLNNAIYTALLADGLADPSSEFEMLGNTATSSVLMRILKIGVEIDFTVANSMRNVLGFNSTVLGPTVVATTEILGPNQAKFNATDYYVIHSSITAQGMVQSGQYQSSIAIVPIDVAPGSNITYAPFRPARISIEPLIGTSISRLKFWLTNQSNTLVNTGSEFYSLRMVLHYYESSGKNQ